MMQVYYKTHEMYGSVLSYQMLAWAFKHVKASSRQENNTSYEFTAVAPHSPVRIL
jgi:hypothetical protein